MRNANLEEKLDPNARAFSAEQQAIIERFEREAEDLDCECGDTQSNHVDAEDQCAVPDCGCKEFNQKLANEEDNGIEQAREEGRL